MPYKKFCVFFPGKLFYKSNRKLFSCVWVAWYKHERHWENSRQLCKPSTNSPNPSRVYIRLCKHGKCFLLLKCNQKSMEHWDVIRGLPWEISCLTCVLSFHDRNKGWWVTIYSMPELQTAHPSAQHARTSTGMWCGFQLKGATAIKVNVTHEDNFHEIQCTSINPDIEYKPKTLFSTDFLEFELAFITV